MAARGLVDIGFRKLNITVIDKTGEFGGIWNQRNVKEASKNNPFRLQFGDIFVDPAPGSGSSIRGFLRRLEGDYNPYYRRFEKGKSLVNKPVKGRVVSVVPGDLMHTVVYEDGKRTRKIKAPIVINATGVGTPLEPSRQDYMLTSASKSEAGIRWQQVITPEQAEKLRGKRLVFIGLGNSTAEMLIQIQKLNAQGFNIDYQVVTHYPKKALNNPNIKVNINGSDFQIFRDLEIPNLTGLAGDLAEIRSAYFQALYEKRVIAGIREWHLDDDKRILLLTQYGKRTSINFDQLYTLIGYGNDPDYLRKAGMIVSDEYTGAIEADFDGEVQKSPGKFGRERVYPGYFALGACLKNEFNPNAEVIPGIMHRMYDQLFTIVIRAAEYNAKKRRRSR